MVFDLSMYAQQNEEEKNEFYSRVERRPSARRVHHHSCIYTWLAYRGSGRETFHYFYIFFKASREWQYVKCENILKKIVYKFMSMSRARAHSLCSHRFRIVFDWMASAHGDQILNEKWTFAVVQQMDSCRHCDECCCLA